jgi:hypothetical protein
MSTRFVFVTFGDREALHVRAWYSMLSVMACAPRDSQFVMVTEHPDRYRWFGDRVRVVPVDARQIRAWRGKHDYLWRIKLEVMGLAAGLGPEPVVYCDCDVVARADLSTMLAEIAQGTVFMHRREIELGRMTRRTMRPLRDHVVGRTWAGIPVTGADAMWNAGVVGIQDHSLVDCAIAMCDEMMESGYQHSLYEQLSFSLTLGATGRLAPAEPWTVHYWDNKEGWSISIAEIVAAVAVRGFDVDGAIDHVRAHPINRPVQVRKKWWNRYFRKLAGADV